MFTWRTSGPPNLCTLTALMVCWGPRDMLDRLDTWGREDSGRTGARAQGGLGGRGQRKVTRAGDSCHRSTWQIGGGRSPVKRMAIAKRMEIHHFRDTSEINQFRGER